LEAAWAIWIDITEEELELLCENLAQNLAAGTFNYGLVAQRFTDIMRQTIEYLNTVTNSTRFYGIEMVRFLGSDLEAFEARTVVKPSAKAPQSPSKPSLNKSAFLDEIADNQYRGALLALFALLEDLGLHFYSGSAGVSIRLPIPGSTTSVTIAWFFPPMKSGWMGLKDATLGYDPHSSSITPAARALLEDYSAAVRAVPGAVVERRGGIEGCHLEPGIVVAERQDLERIFKKLVFDISNADTVS
jgi:hypothetical protein